MNNANYANSVFWMLPKISDYFDLAEFVKLLWPRLCVDYAKFPINWGKNCQFNEFDSNFCNFLLGTLDSAIELTLLHELVSYNSLLISSNKLRVQNFSAASQKFGKDASENVINVYI